MLRSLRSLPIVIVGAWLATTSMACGSSSTSAPAEPATAATPNEPAQTAATEPPGGAKAPVPPDTPETAGTGQAGTTKFVPPIRGTADLAYVAPKTAVKNNVVTTTIIVRNTSTGSIAGLKIEEYWWDKASNPVTGDSVRLTKPLMPGETATLTLETPKDPRMFRNTYVFRHAFGQIKATAVKSLE